MFVSMAFTWKNQEGWPVEFVSENVAVLFGYPVKAMITWGSNPMMWAANTKATYHALKSPNLELHVVS
jgi:anaerobic selenocysteine-containing dehydrogenase